MQKMVIKVVKIIIATAIFAWFGLFLAHKIDLTTADLGRHIVNGSIILHGSWAEKWAVLNTNFYSYTLPNQPFVNHHWGSGVVFYLIFLAFGFAGLSVFYVGLGLATLWLFFDVARRASNFWISSAVTISLIPLLSARAEVRPEMFTYFFTGVFFWVLWKSRNDAELNAERRGSYKLLWILPIIVLLWVNLHIGFVFGFLVLGAFGLEEIIRNFPFRMHLRNLLNPGTDRSLRSPSDALGLGWDGKLQKLIIISALCILAGLINPFGYKLLIYPAQIFKNYGYLIVENQSIRFLERLNFVQGQHFLLFKLAVAGVIISFIGVAIRWWRKIDITMLVLVIITAFMAYLGIRNFPSFAFFALPAAAGNLYLIKPQNLHRAYKYSLSVILIFIVIICAQSQYQTFMEIRPVLGFGVLPGVNQSADFYKANNLKGPIFNNYDVGGYLIYHLYQKNHPLLASPIKGEEGGTDTKLFVDNRPEAYTTDFFENSYKLPQTDSQKWQELDNRYNFNSIFFSHRDYTPWGQAFLISRIQDPTWAPVFVDTYNIIFVKRNPQNADLIKKYELPKSMFGIK